MKGTMTPSERAAVEALIGEWQGGVNNLARLCTDEQVLKEDDVEARRGRQRSMLYEKGKLETLTQKIASVLMEHYLVVRP